VDFFFRIVGLWRTELAKTNEKAAESIANPEEYENLFPELSQTLQVEKVRKPFDLLVLCVTFSPDAYARESSTKTSITLSYYYSECIVPVPVTATWLSTVIRAQFRHFNSMFSQL